MPATKLRPVAPPREYLACAPEKHEQLKRDVATFAANAVGLYEYVSARGRYLSGSCIACFSDVSMRIGSVLEGAPIYVIRRDVLT